MRKWNLVLALWCLPLLVWAQDPQLSQFYAAPLFHNPAMAGSERLNRIAVNLRNQWPGVPGSFVTAAASWDTWLPEYRSGVGAMITHDRAGVAALASTSVNGVYSYHLPLSKKWKASFGGQAGVVNRNLDFYELTFGDQLQNENGTQATNDPTARRAVSKYYLDLGVGTMLYSRWSWVGVSYTHLNRPNQSVQYRTSERLPARLLAHAGFVVPLEDRTHFKKNQPVTRALFPTVQYRQQGPYRQFDGGFYCQLEPLLLGAFYRGFPIRQNFPTMINQDALSFIVGIHIEGFRFGYSYDYSLSQVVPGSNGSHEISVMVLIPGKDKGINKVYGALPCPRF